MLKLYIKNSPEKTDVIKTLKNVLRIKLLKFCADIFVCGALWPTKCFLAPRYFWVRSKIAHTPTDIFDIRGCWSLGNPAHKCIKPPTGDTTEPYSNLVHRYSVVACIMLCPTTRYQTSTDRWLNWRQSALVCPQQVLYLRLVPSPSEINVVLRYEYGRVFPTGVGLKSSSTDAVSRLSS